MRESLVAAMIEGADGAALSEEEAASMVDLSALEFNEFVTIQEVQYEEAYGDIVASFRFVTEYAAGQKLTAIMGFYTGEMDANGEYVVEWIVVNAEANEDGTVRVHIPQNEMARMQNATAVSLAILSMPVA